MPSYETLPPNNFLGLGEEHSGYADSAALILPIPYEGTVSYGQGTDVFVHDIGALLASG